MISNKRKKQVMNDMVVEREIEKNFRDFKNKRCLSIIGFLRFLFSDLSYVSWLKYFLLTFLVYSIAIQSFTDTYCVLFIIFLVLFLVYVSVVKF